MSGVDAALAQPTQAATLMVAAIMGAVAWVLPATPSLIAPGIFFGAALVGAILGVLGLFYLQGWFVEGSHLALSGVAPDCLYREFRK